MAVFTEILFYLVVQLIILSSIGNKLRYLCGLPAISARVELSPVPIKHRVQHFASLATVVMQHYWTLTKFCAVATRIVWPKSSSKYSFYTLGWLFTYI